MKKHKRQTKPFAAGILIQSNTLIVTKSKREAERIAIIAYETVELTTGNDFFSKLDHALGQVPKDFFSRSDVSVCLGNQHVSYEQVLVPGLAEAEVPAFVQKSVKDIKNVWWDFLPIPASGSGLSNQALVVQAKKDVISNYLSVFKKHHIKPILLTAAPKPMLKAIHESLIELKSKLAIVADMDFEKTSLTIIQDNRLKRFRTADIGLKNFIDELTSKMKIDAKTALAYLQDPDVFDVNAHKDKPTMDRVYVLVWSILEKVTNELKKSIQLMAHEQQAEKVMVHLTGNFFWLHKVNLYFARELGVPVDYLAVPNTITEKMAAASIQDTCLLCLSAALSLDTDEQLRFDLTPVVETVGTAKSRRVVLVLSGLALFLTLFVNYSFIAHRRAVSALNNEITGKQTAINQLENVKRVRTGIPEKSASNKDAQFFGKVVSERIPIEKILYELNLKHSFDVRLNGLLLDKTQFKLSGLVRRRTMNASISSYINSLTQIPFLHDLRLDLVQGSDQELASFTIYATASPR